MHYKAADHRGFSYTIDPVDEREVLKSIRAAKQLSDFVIVTIHAHEPGNWSQEPADFLPRLAHAAIDAGADEFIGHGPHQIRGIEIYNGKPIFYSLGNFIFQLDLLEPVANDLYEQYKMDASTATDAEFNAMWNKLVFTGDEWYQSIVTTTPVREGTARRNPAPPDGSELHGARRRSRRAAARHARSRQGDPRAAATPVAAVRHDDRDRTGHRRHPSGVAAGDRGETVVRDRPISSPRVPLLHRHSASALAGLSVAAALVGGCGGSKPSSPPGAGSRRPESRRRRRHARCPRRRKRETVDQFKVFHRLPVHRPAAGERHHLRSPRRRRRRQALQGRSTTTTATASPSADVDGDGLLDIYFVNQVGGSELWKNLGGGRFSEHHEGGRRRAAPTASASPRRSPTSTTTATRTSSSPPSAAATSLFENDGTGHFRDIIEEPRASIYVGHSSGAVFFDYDSDGLLDLLRLQRRPIHDRSRRDRDGAYVGLADAFLGHHASGPHRVSASSTRTWATTGSRTSPRTSGCGRRAGAATPASPT